MKRKRLLFIMIGLFLLLHGWSLHSQAVVDRVVAVVNEEIITLSEVEKRSHPLQEEIQTTDRLERRKRIQEIFRKVLDRLVEEKLIDQEVKKSGIKVSIQEVEAAVEEIRQKNDVNQEQFKQLLAAEGLTPEAFKQEVEKRILRTKLVNWAVKVEYMVGERELRDFYQRNADRYRINESYRPSHILFVIPKEATARQIRETRKRCQEVLERIKKGEDFGELARLYSEDNSSAKDRGDLGYFKKGELLPILEKEAANLQIGEVSGIIRTDFGFHILKLLDRKGGEPAPFEEIRERIQADYYEKEMERAFQQFLTKLKEKAIIEIKL
jgi:peptidyl-prolyl cis-trans isomerase SurA